MKNKKVLIIDDEIQIRKLLEITLRSNGYEVMQAATSGEGINKTAGENPDIILLDLLLPDADGHQTLLLLREWFTNPVIILSVQSSEENIVKALDNGANDYLTKPFRSGELLARIRSVLRDNPASGNYPVIKYKNLEIDLSARTVKANNGIIKLTITQYALLVLLAKNEGKVLTHQYILKEIWGENHVDQLQYLRVYINQLRKLLENEVEKPASILSESGVGYRFRAE